MVLLESESVAMGESAKDFLLMGVDDKVYALSEFSAAKVLVVVFMCNHCPYVQAVWDRLVHLQAMFEEKGVKFVGINPNLNPAYPEESLEKMKEYSERYKMNFPYLLDETQEVAKSYGAVCTPDIFVYDSEQKLAYHGRIDDNWQHPEEVQDEELKNAIEKILAGQVIEGRQNPAMGCSIKWRDK